MRLQVRTVIYFYIFVCIVLLVFNLLYIFRSENIKREHRKRVRRWNWYLESFSQGKPIWQPKKVERKLWNIQELMAFHEGMEGWNQTQKKGAESFFKENHETILKVAERYRGKAAMEQAFFAYVIAAFHPKMGEKRDALMERLLSYLDNSTVFSRENVLNALYALGNAQAVEHAFVLMSQHGWYHDPRLLADGLNRFQGEKELLAGRLWDIYDGLTECFQVGILRFIDGLPGDHFAGPILKALEMEELPVETRFTMIRYFRRHPFPEAKPVLLKILKGEAEGKREFAIAAATSLAAYADDESREALKEALHSPNWYVRQNAARSLKTLGVTWEEARASAAGDRYATEMLEYILEARPAVSEKKKEGEAVATV